MEGRKVAHYPVEHETANVVKMLSDKDCCTKDDTSVKFVGENCSSYNVIYLFTCKICSKCYVGRSTRPLKTRVGEHRR